MARAMAPPPEASVVVVELCISRSAGKCKLLRKCRSENISSEQSIGHFIVEGLFTWVKSPMNFKKTGITVTEPCYNEQNYSKG